jgi:hypothetical protein
MSNPCHWHDFPPSPRTLWELTHVATSVFRAMSNSLIRELSILYLVAIILMLQSGMEHRVPLDPGGNCGGMTAVPDQTL